MSASRRFKTKTVFSAGFILIGLAIGTLFIEPMRWVLPARYLVAPLELFREGGIDYRMCMRVKLSKSETKTFLGKMFEQGIGVSKIASPQETQCPARFWPSEFRTETIAYIADTHDDGWVEGTTGAVYEGGHLYFWSNTM